MADTASLATAKEQPRTVGRFSGGQFPIVDSRAPAVVWVDSGAERSAARRERLSGDSVFVAGW